MLPYGVRPRLDRPLRAEPVRRDEVYVHPTHWFIVTMPLGTYYHHLAPDDPYWNSLVSEPGLWADVLKQIQAEYDAVMARRPLRIDTMDAETRQFCEALAAAIAQQERPAPPAAEQHRRRL